ncbi:antitermination protein Q [Serratia fonticola]|uniref:antiterminator Q family protein n=1 Tax=Serratia fonticola TaxID=47917 RepID=UPI0015C6705D|nr:antiterminator Q family protein [Serratia fonticola]MBC3378472.1 antitermination protein Q [Serratia fonticola]NYA37672.1 antitermination protein Q [Serratia fonticola]
MRDIQDVLERWGGWVSSDCSSVDYSPIAAGFKGLLPQSSKTRISCCDDDGLIIEGCIARLKARRPDEHRFIVLHYVFNMPKRSIARAFKKDEKLIRVALLMGEHFVEGCLSSLDIKLEMEV